MSATATTPKGRSGSAAPAPAAEPDQYLTFMLGGEVFAVGILHIKEIIEFGDLTEVPMMPAYIRGVINLRGRVVPVVDLSARFGRGTTAVARRTSIVIVETLQDEDTNADHRGDYVGVMVDAVNEVVEIAAQDIEPPPAFGTRIQSAFISGMARRAGQFTIVLDVQQILSPESLGALVPESAAQAGAGSPVAAG